MKKPRLGIVHINGANERVEIIDQMRFPHSSLTRYVAVRPNGGLLLVVRYHHGLHFDRVTHFKSGFSGATTKDLLKGHA